MLRARLLPCLVFVVVAAGCRRLEGGLEIEVKFQGFTPGCLDVTVVDRLDSTHNGTTQVQVSSSRPHTVAVGMGDGWSRSWSLSVAAHEGGCSGKIVASVTDEVEIPEGTPILKSYTLNAIDADRDGWVATSSGGTDCDDQQAMSAPGLNETCGDGLDNDCVGGIDCVDPSCSAQPCDDGDFCTVSDTCGSAGCTGAPRDCGPPASPCRQADAGRCEPGGCFWPLLPVGTACGGGMACNSSGVCVPANTELNCADGLDDDNDDAGIDCGDVDCNGIGCDAGRCTTGATCQAGACAGAPLQCPAPALCRDAGVCNPSTGACDFAPSPPGSACTQNACVLGQSCDGLGACAGGTPVVCDAGACETAFCDGGACLVLARNGGPCDDDAGCTHSDLCVNGVCTGTGYVCPPPGDCQTGGACEGDGGCTYASVANGSTCDGGFCLAGACRLFPYAPSNVDPAALTPSGALLVNCAATFDSSDGGGTWCGAAPAVYLVAQDGGEPAAVISVRGLMVTADGGSLTLRGSRPVIALVWDPGATLIDGLVDARGLLAAPGPGGNRSTCGLQAGGIGGNNASQRGSGGGGGGFATRGGWGSPSDTGNVPGGDGGTAGPAVLTPLVGGCPGGRGGTTTSGMGGPGGAGGGALQLSAAGILRLGPNAVVSVSGGGASGTPNSSRGGGGGGGSGGAILLEGVGLDLLAGAWLTANGGGGGEGADADEPGDRGDDGASASSTPAAGGTGLSNSGASGGAGAAGATGPETPTLGGNAVGGGGGGAAGRIHLRANGGSCNRTATFSPAFTNAGGCP